MSHESPPGHQCNGRLTSAPRASPAPERDVPGGRNWDGPGPTPPPRILHPIYRFHPNPELRPDLAQRKLDELPDGRHEVGVIEWINYRTAAELSILPPIGSALATLANPRATAALDAVTDAKYIWL
ncbi:hypothetical protein AB0M58_27320 [Streptomyces bobili]|uniref:hypothetical protein n=1 Tax=Streptomyces bobili TaxID=67280 RepID=UPI00343ABAF5